MTYRKRLSGILFLRAPGDLAVPGCDTEHLEFLNLLRFAVVQYSLPVEHYLSPPFNDAMATLNDAMFVQERLGYKFQNQDILLLALTAAGRGGAEDEEDRPGNSRLAHLGNFLMQFLLAWVGFSNNWSRGKSALQSTTPSLTCDNGKPAQLH